MLVDLTHVLRDATLSEALAVGLIEAVASSVAQRVPRCLRCSCSACSVLICQLGSPVAGGWARWLRESTVGSAPVVGALVTVHDARGASR